MTLTQLQHFICAARYQNLSRAAEELFVSHSTISRSISSLEHELGTSLLIRNSHNIICTPAGTLLLEKGSKILNELELLKADIVKMDSELSKHLRIGCASISLPSFFDFYQTFSLNNPETSFELSPLSPAEINSAILSGDIDLGLTFSYSIVQNSKTRFIPLEEGHFCAFVANSHPLAQKKKIAMSALSDYNILFPSLESRRIFKKADANLITANLMDLPYSTTLNEIGLQVKSGTAVAFLPEHTAEDLAQNCVSIPLQIKKSAYEVGLFYKYSNHNPILLEFLEGLASIFSTILSDS